MPRLTGRAAHGCNVFHTRVDGDFMGRTGADAVSALPRPESAMFRLSF